MRASKFTYQRVAYYPQLRKDSGIDHNVLHGTYALLGLERFPHLDRGNGARHYIYDSANADPVIARMPSSVAIDSPLLLQQSRLDSVLQVMQANAPAHCAQNDRVNKCGRSRNTPISCAKKSRLCVDRCLCKWSSRFYLDVIVASDAVGSTLRLPRRRIAFLRKRVSRLIDSISLCNAGLWN